MPNEHRPDCVVGGPKIENKLSVVQAAECGFVEICQLLIDSGCDADAQNSSGETPLLLASIEGHTDVVQLLVATGRSHATTDCEAQLHKCCTESTSSLPFTPCVHPRVLCRRQC